MSIGIGRVFQGLRIMYETWNGGDHSRVATMFPILDFFLV